MKYIVRYPKPLFKLENNKIFFMTNNSLVTDFSEVLSLGIEIKEDDMDIQVQLNLEEDCEIMLTNLISITTIRGA